MPEKSILYSAEFRSVRLDVYARDGMQVEYDLEMQNEDQGWEAKYMKLEEMLQRKLDDGLRQGIQKGIVEGIALTKRVLRLNAQGKSVAEISALCGISRAEVADILNMNE